MSVIGRLDRQVEDVLIGPVGRRGRDEGGRPAPQPEAGAPAQDSGDRRPANPQDESSHQPSGATESPTRAGELPVWML
jgi:hypothetical protein